MTTDSTDGEIEAMKESVAETKAGELKGGVLIYKTPDGEFINISLGSEQVRSLNEWFKTERLKSAVDAGARGNI